MDTRERELCVREVHRTRSGAGAVLIVDPRIFVACLAKRQAVALLRDRNRNQQEQGSGNQRRRHGDQRRVFHIKSPFTKKRSLIQTPYRPDSNGRLRNSVSLGGGWQIRIKYPTTFTRCETYCTGSCAFLSSLFANNGQTWRPSPRPSFTRSPLEAVLLGQMSAWQRQRTFDRIKRSIERVSQPGHGKAGIVSAPFRIF